MPTPCEPRGRALLPALLGLSLVLGVALAVLGPVAPAAAVGTPVLIDNFGGSFRGTRTVTELPRPGESTTPRATFTESGGLGTLEAPGNGNGRGGVELDYHFPGTDLTSGDPDSQFFLEFTSIQRLPVVANEPSVNVTINLTDASNNKSTYGTAIQNTDAFNIVLNFDCDVNPVCFKPAVDFTTITDVQVQLFSPRSPEPDHMLTAVLDTIRTSTPGGTVPPPPAPDIARPSDPTFGLSGSTVDFTVTFTSNGENAPVSHTPNVTDGLRAQDLVPIGRAPGFDKLAVTGGPSVYQVTVGPITGSGPIGILVPAGIVTDGWGQQNVANASSTLTFTVAVPPRLSSAAPAAAEVGKPYSHRFAAGGTPAATYAVSAGALPRGLALAGDGTLSGTPTTSGSYGFTVTATNRADDDAQDVTLVVSRPAAITSPSSASFVVGRAGTFTVTSTGYPTPTLSATGLPDGLTLTDGVDGTATIAGIPTGPAGPARVTLTATNGAGSVDQTLTLDVNSSPAFDPLPDAVFMTGTPGTYDIGTTGVPTPAITSAALPAGLTLTDHHDGTATIAGTPTGTGESARVTLTARNSVSSGTGQLSVVVQDAPAITSGAAATFVVGTEAAFTVTTTGFPAPAMMVDGDLPAGLVLVDHGNGTATLSGTADAPGGETPVTIRATNVAGSAEQPLSVVVQAEPVITSSDAATFAVGATVQTFTVVTSGFPVPAITPTGALPDGLTFADHGDGTATIEGSPTEAGEYPVSLEATNIAGTGGQTITVRVKTAPLFVGGADATFELGVPGSHRIGTTGAPAAVISALGPLPAGLTLTDLGDGTATLAGTPTATGSWAVDLRASNPAGTAEITLTVAIR